eukprot:COSAG01_NODE_369_length_18046_cov_130.301443_13_plen_35_part_00
MPTWKDFTHWSVESLTGLKAEALAWHGPYVAILK